MTREYKKQLQKIMNAKPEIRFENSAINNEHSLYIYGAIGGWFSNNNAEGVRRELKDVKADKIHVHINSGGGSAFDGIAISNMLKQHKAEIIIHIDGWAASAASIIAMAGDKIIMPSNTMMMIHRASTYGYGNAGDFEKIANDLKKIDTAVTASYEKRFVGERSELIQLLEDETFLTADEAVAFGLADEIADEIEIKDIEEDDDEETVENFKDDLLEKYAANANKNNEPQKEPEQAPAAKRNLSTLFLNL